jgi:hypothetical protein
VGYAAKIGKEGRKEGKAEMNYRIISCIGARKGGERERKLLRRERERLI